MSVFVSITHNQVASIIRLSLDFQVYLHFKSMHAYLVPLLPKQNYEGKSPTKHKEKITKGVTIIIENMLKS